MEILAASLGTVAVILAIVCIQQTRELRRRRVSMGDIADKAAELSAKTHISYDTAMQSLTALYNLYPERLKK